MKNKLANAILIGLIGFPVIATAQESFPEGSVPNEHNIAGAEYPRIGADNRVPCRIHAPNAIKS